MQNLKRTLAALVCVCMVALSFLSIEYMAVNAGHDCDHGRCDICLTIAHCKELLKRWSDDPVFFGGGLFVLLLCCAVFYGSQRRFAITPVALKVQMNR